MLKYLLIGLAAAGSLAHAAPPPQHFFGPSQFKDAQLSPSGRYLAMRVPNEGQRDGMIVIDSETGAMVGGAKWDGLDIANVRWVNDNRLVYTLNDSKVAPGDMLFAPGLFAVDRDGSNRKQLVEQDHSAFGASTQIARKIQPWNTFLLNDLGAQDSEYIYARRPEWDERGRAILRTNLVRLNTSTGIATFVDRPTAATYWMLDHKGQPSIMGSLHNGQTTIHYRDPATEKWRDLASFAAYDTEAASFAPAGFLDDRTLLVRTRLTGDKAALYRLDLASGKIDPQPLVALTDFDFSGDMVYSNKRLAGIHFVGDARDTVWFDPALKAAQAEVDKKLPGLINTLTPPLAPEVPWVLVSSYSDRQPLAYLLYNTKTGQIKVVGATHPEIKPAEMGRQAMVKIQARDGLQFPVWLTMPPQGGKKLPLVVLVHGGPYMRGTDFGWDPIGQFLATRGYAVLEPEFRGTTGYGFGLFKAGMKQWGLSMQDDIADSVKWAIAQGHADPDRICIMGGSYGGYATLMGLIKDPGLYRCGVAYAAVADIPLMLDGMMWLSDASDEYRKFGAPVLLGDADKDAERFKATSPLQQAARLKRPLLLAHGSDDRRVPRVHFTRMRSALEDHKADAEFVEYVGEGHGWYLSANSVDFWTRVEKFLGKHIGAGAKKE